MSSQTAGRNASKVKGRERKCPNWNFIGNLIKATESSEWKVAGDLMPWVQLFGRQLGT